jgi:WhiB family redox-sensing transcriptional regulator
VNPYSATRIFGGHSEPDGPGEMGWRPPHWTESALCAEIDPEAFFVEKGGSARPAKRVCGSCEVRAECLACALENDDRFGVWGGLSERERRRLKARFGGDIAAAVASVVTPGVIAEAAS